MLIRLQDGQIINLYNVASIVADKSGTMGVKYVLNNNSIFTEVYATEAEVDARIEELMGYNIGLSVPEYNQAIETANEILGQE